MSRPLLTDLDAAVAALERGRPVLVHDGDDREHEVDLLYPARAVAPGDVARLRHDAGGLLFVALPDAVARTFDLPFLHEAVDHPATEYDHVGYDARPSFSLSVNHRTTYTGVTDADRSRTIRALAAAAAAPEATDFAAEFRAPGHVHLLRGAPGGLTSRQGHTELGLALAAEAEGVAAIAGCEMLDDASGGALDPRDARRYAREHDLVYLEAADVIATLR
ncbi:MAG: 3,4-dihydroxy-2-butanone-4-phosphate synthase [Halobacteriales archaeon]